VFTGQLVVFVLLNGLLATVAIALARRLGGDRLSQAELAAGALILFAGQIVVYQLILGAVGQLTYMNVLVLGGTLASIILIVLWRRGHWPHRANPGPEVRPVVLAEVGTFPLVILVLSGVALMAYLIWGLGRPPLNGDDLGYHLPFTVNWLQSSWLTNTNPPFWFYPGMSELFVLWLVAPFRSDIFVSLQNWPFLALALVSLYALARREGLSIQWSACGALFFTGILALYYQLNSENNDVVWAALLLGALVFMLAYHASPQRGHLVLVGVAMGLAMGTKYNAALFVALFCLTYAWLGAGHESWRRISMNLAIILSITLVVGGYWYIRNWVIAGNPLTPIQLRVGQWVLFPGSPTYMGNNVTDTTLLGRMGEANIRALFWAALSKNGWLTTLAIPVWICALLRYLYGLLDKRRRALSGVELVLNLFLPACLFVLLAITPLLVENNPGTLNLLKDGYTPARFGLLSWALAGLTIAWLLSLRDPQLALPSSRLLVLVIMLPGLLTPFAFARSKGLPGAIDWQVNGGELVAMGLIFGVFMILEKLQVPGFRQQRDTALSAVAGLWHRYQSHGSSKRRRVLVWCLVVGVLLVAVAVAGDILRTARAATRDRMFAGFFSPTYPAAQQQVMDQGHRRLALIGWTVPYFWYGSDFRNQVFICPSSSKQVLRACAESYTVDSLVVARTSMTKESLSTIDSLLQSCKDWLRPVYRDETVEIYRVVR